jgi:hypothetical protein
MNESLARDIAVHVDDVLPVEVARHTRGEDHIHEILTSSQEDFVDVLFHGQHRRVVVHEDGAILDGQQASVLDVEHGLEYAHGDAAVPPQVVVGINSVGVDPGNDRVRGREVKGELPC